VKDVILQDDGPVPQYGDWFIILVSGSGQLSIGVANSHQLREYRHRAYIFYPRQSPARATTYRRPRKRWLTYRLLRLLMIGSVADHKKSTPFTLMPHIKARIPLEPHA